MINLIKLSTLGFSEEDDQGRYIEFFKPDFNDPEATITFYKGTLANWCGAVSNLHWCGAGHAASVSNLHLFIRLAPNSLYGEKIMKSK